MEASIRNRYVVSRNRLFFLDYDGTLVDFTAKPSDTFPSHRTIETLKALTRDPANTVVIVSGRDYKTLEAWLGNLPIDLVAEHGIALREKFGHWKLPIRVKARNWKRAVRSIMRRAAAKTSGSFVEEKSSSLVWHFRRTETARTLKVERNLEEELAPVISKHNLKVMNGHNIVEVLPAEVGKGEVAKFWLKKHEWEFILAAGDDTTDEDLFAEMPDSAFTIKVRPGKSQAKYRLPSTTDLLTLLTSLPSTHN